MSFLTPLFLFGGLALALPVLFHLSRRATRKRTAFSSLMFLAPTAPRLKRRSRLEQWLLLILRCLALALLALGFARPFMKDGSPIVPVAEQPRQVVLLLDTSASLRRDGAWADALSKADEVVRALRPIDRFSVICFGRETKTVLDFAEWEGTPPDARTTLARARLASLSPTWEGTRLGQALVAAADAFSDAERDGREHGAKEIVLVSDLQAGGRLESLQAYEWPKDVKLNVARVTPARGGNAGVHWLAGSAGNDVGGKEIVRIRVTNTNDSPNEQFSLTWKRGTVAVGDPVGVQVPPGQSRVVTMGTPRDAAGIDRIELSGDGVPFDNTVYLAPPEKQRLRVAYVGPDNPSDATRPLYFLKHALESSPRAEVKLSQNPEGGLGLATTPAGMKVGFLTALPPGGGPSLRTWIESGGTLVAVPASAEAATTLARALVGVEMSASDVRPAAGGYAMWGEIDFKHPLFSPFADPRYSDFTKIHIWRYRRLDVSKFEAAHMLARFDSGDPAMIETPLGKGKILWLATGWQPEDSQLAVSSKFVPLVWSILDYANVTQAEVSQYFVGDSLQLPVSTNPVTVLGPDGGSQSLAPGNSRLLVTRFPGIYEVNADGAATRFMVNLDPSESRTEPLSIDDLEQFGVLAQTAEGSRLAAGEGERQASLLAVESEGRQKLWRWFIAATLAVLLSETILAARADRKARGHRQEVAS
ncbi:MAG: BatA domain-containing protein [Opitutaceae bacterium]|nr:BatA domain-containing protein [Opitutaceae bacterium]